MAEKRDGEGSPEAALHRAVAGVERAIGRLVDCPDSEPDVVMRAARALAEIGPCAAGPLATVFVRPRSPQGRLLVAALLARLGPLGRIAIDRAMLNLFKGKNRKRAPVRQR